MRPTNLKRHLLIALRGYLLLGGLLLSGAYSGRAQDADSAEIDSLQNVIESVGKDSAQIKALARWAALIAGSDSEKNRALHLEVIARCEAGLAKPSVGKERLFYQQRLAESWGHVGINYYLAAQFREAVRYELKALELFDTLDNKARMAICHVVIGAIYKRQKDYAEALGHYQEALRLNQEINNPRGMALAYNNLGIIHQDKKNYQAAVETFHHARRLYTSVDDQRGIGTEYINLGTAHESLKDLDSALYFYQASLDVRNTIDDQQGLIFSHARMGSLRFTLGEISVAREHALASLELAEEKQITRGQRDAFELLAKVYEAEGKHRQALQYYQRFTAFKDSLSSEESLRAVTQAEFDYKFEKDSLANVEEQLRIQSELTVEQLKNEQRTRESYFLYGGLGLALLLGLWIFNRYRAASRQQAIIANQKQEVDKAYDALHQRDEEKELLLKEIHHRVKNNLQVISSLLDLQTRNIEDQGALSAIEDGQNRVKAMALIHQKLYQNEDIGTISFEEYSRQLIGQIASLFPHGSDVQVEVDKSDAQLDIDTAVPLGLILNELLTNAYKYGFASLPSGQGKIRVSLAPQSEEGSYLLTVKDNGPGLPEDFEIRRAKSLGLRLVRRLSRQLYGKADYSYEGGAVFRVSFKDTLTRKETA